MWTREWFMLFDIHGIYWSLLNGSIYDWIRLGGSYDYLTGAMMEALG